MFSYFHIWLIPYGSRPRIFVFILNKSMEKNIQMSVDFSNRNSQYFFKMIFEMNDKMMEVNLNERHFEGLHFEWIGRSLVFKFNKCSKIEFFTLNKNISLTI